VSQMINTSMYQHI